MSLLSGIKVGDLCLVLLDEELNLVCQVGGLRPFDINAKQVSHSAGSVSGKNTT